MRSDASLDPDRRRAVRSAVRRMLRLDEDLTDIAALEVSQVKEKLSICSVTSGDAGAVAKGMAVHLR